MNYQTSVNLFGHELTPKIKQDCIGLTLIMVDEVTRSNYKNDENNGAKKERGVGINIYDNLSVGRRWWMGVIIYEP